MNVVGLLTLACHLLVTASLSPNPQWRVPGATLFTDTILGYGFFYPGRTSDAGGAKNGWAMPTQTGTSGATEFVTHDNDTTVDVYYLDAANMTQAEMAIGGLVSVTVDGYQEQPNQQPSDTDATSDAHGQSHGADNGGTGADTVPYGYKSAQADITTTALDSAINFTYTVTVDQKPVVRYGRILATGDQTHNLIFVIKGASQAAVDDATVECWLPIATTTFNPPTILKKGTSVQVSVVGTLSSATARPGDQVSLQIADDVYAPNGNLFLQKGAPAFGIVLVSHHRSFPVRSGQLVLAIEYALAPDGTPVYFENVPPKAGAPLSREQQPRKINLNMVPRPTPRFPGADVPIYQMAPPASNWPLAEGNDQVVFATQNVGFSPHITFQTVDSASRPPTPPTSQPSIVTIDSGVRTATIPLDAQATANTAVPPSYSGTIPDVHSATVWATFRVPVNPNNVPSNSYSTGSIYVSARDQQALATLPIMLDSLSATPFMLSRSRYVLAPASTVGGGVIEGSIIIPRNARSIQITSSDPTNAPVDSQTTMTPDGFENMLEFKVDTKPVAARESVSVTVSMVDPDSGTKVQEALTIHIETPGANVGPMGSPTSLYLLDLSIPGSSDTHGLQGTVDLSPGRPLQLQLEPPADDVTHLAWEAGRADTSADVILPLLLTGVVSYAQNGKSAGTNLAIGLAALTVLGGSNGTATVLYGNDATVPDSTIYNVEVANDTTVVPASGSGSGPSGSHPSAAGAGGAGVSPLKYSGGSSGGSKSGAASSATTSHAGASTPSATHATAPGAGTESPNATGGGAGGSTGSGGSGGSAGSGGSSMAN